MTSISNLHIIYLILEKLTIISNVNSFTQFNIDISWFNINQMGVIMRINQQDVIILEAYLEANNFESVTELLETYDTITNSCKKIYAVLDSLGQVIELR